MGVRQEQSTGEPMKNYVSKGANLAITAAAAIMSGQFVVVGAIRGVAQGDAAIGDDVVIVREGVFDLPKATGEAWGVGDLIYWDATNAVMTKTATDNTLAGVATDTAASADVIGRLWIDNTVR